MASSSSFSVLPLLLCLLCLSPSLTFARKVTFRSAAQQHSFLQCLSEHTDIAIPFSTSFFTPENTTFSTVLNSTAQNLRLLLPSVQKPVFIFTPLQVSHIQSAVLCSKQLGIHLRIRSGGHDYEGVSTAGKKPYIVVDMFNLNGVQVDVKSETAWVESGAQLGELYYAIAKQTSHLAFPAGICPTVGVGGHFGGGGFGTLVRKYGLAADNVIDAYLIDARGKVMNRKEMGEEVFWAIRGGGAGSFGIVVSWKVKLVRVPEKLTFFSVSKTLEQGANGLIHKWQRFGHDAPQDLFVRILILNSVNGNGNKTVEARFQSLFLGTIDKLIPIVNHTFPELGLKAENCTEMTWGESTLEFAGFKSGSAIEALLDKTQMFKAKFKAKTDFVTMDPISETGLEEIWKMMLEEDVPIVVLEPLGGVMNEISESETPFPHRKGHLYNIQYLVKWEGGGVEDETKHLGWMNKVYNYMEPHVSKSPRAAYLNYRDLDLGEKSKGWGEKYFKGNFERLCKVKSVVDPEDFFRNEQSIPLFK
ncbi:Berberine bridge enzyme-like 15 [Linum grandiflorum]